MSQQFIRGLSAIFLQSRHIDVVNKHNHLFISDWPHFVPPLLCKLILVHEDIQNVLGAGLCREVEHRVAVLFGVEGRHELSDDNGLTHSRFTTYQAVVSSEEQFFQDILEFYGICSRDENAEIRHAFDVLELFDEFSPRMELFLGEVDVVVIDLPFVWEAVEELHYFPFDVLAEPYSRIIFDTVVEICSG